jgi:hypothetical protein
VLPKKRIEHEVRPLFLFATFVRNVFCCDEYLESRCGACRRGGGCTGKYSSSKCPFLLLSEAAGMAQTVKRLATDWAVR